MNTRSTGRTSSASVGVGQREIGGVGVDHAAAPVGDQEAVDRLVDHRLEHRIAGLLAGDAQDAGGEREQREHADHGEEGEQREDIGRGVAAADQQQPDRRADQRDRDQQHHADAAAARAGLAAVDGGRPCASLEVLRSHDGFCPRSRRRNEAVPWCPSRAGFAQGFRGFRPRLRHCGSGFANDAKIPTLARRPAQLHDIADDLGHRLVVLGRDFLVDLDRGVQRARERRVLHHRDRMLGRDLADLQRQRVDALGEADRRVHAALVLQGDGVVGRVGDDDRGLRHRGDHALAHPALAQLPDLALDHRVAFGLLELLLHLAQRHFLPLVPLPVLEQVVGGGDEGEDRDHRAQHVERKRARERERAENVGLHQAFEPMALRPQQREHHRADHHDLDQALGEIGQRLLGEQPLQAGKRRNLAQLRLQRLGRPDQTMLDHVADDRGQREQRDRDRDRRQHLAAEPRRMIASRPRPSTGIWWALAIRPRNVVASPPLIEPENAASTSVPPAITNQV